MPPTFPGSLSITAISLLILPWHIWAKKDSLIVDDSPQKGEDLVGTRCWTNGNGLEAQWLEQGGTVDRGCRLDLLSSVFSNHKYMTGRHVLVQMQCRGQVGAEWLSRRQTVGADYLISYHLSTSWRNSTVSEAMALPNSEVEFPWAALSSAMAIYSNAPFGEVFPG